MTEPRPAGRRPGSAPVFWISVALFCLLLGVLTHRLADESGPAAAAPAEAAPRKVIVRRVVTTIVPAGPATASAGVPAATETAPVEALPAAAPVESVPVTTSAS